MVAHLPVHTLLSVESLVSRYNVSPFVSVSVGPQVLLWVTVMVAVDDAAPAPLVSTAVAIKARPVAAVIAATPRSRPFRR